MTNFGNSLLAAGTAPAHAQAADPGVTPAPPPLPWQIDDAIRAEFRAVVTQWRLTMPRSTAIGICSWLPKQGCSGAAARLACAAAEDGDQVALLDATGENRQPPLFGLKYPEAESALPSLVSYKTSFSTLTLFGADAGAAAPAVVTSYGGLIGSLRRDRSAVIVDLPAAAHSTVVRELAMVLDGLILTVNAEDTRRDDVHTAVAFLQSLEPRFLGIVVNRHRRYIPQWAQTFLKARD